MERVLLAAVGGGMTLVGGLFAAYFLGQLTSGTSRNTPGINAGLVALFGGLLAAGLFLLWRALRSVRVDGGDIVRPDAASANAGPPTPPSPSTDGERERAVLRMAEHEHGRVTLPEVAARCNLTVAEAKVVLDRLVDQQVAHREPTASGGLRYVFRGFLTDEEKARAGDF